MRRSYLAIAFLFVQILFYLYSICAFSGCDHTYTSPHGNLTSPGYPDNYENNLDCTYIVTVQQKYDIILTFLYVDIEYSGFHEPCRYDCGYDYLQVLVICFYLNNQPKKRGTSELEI